MGLRGALPLAGGAAGGGGTVGEVPPGAGDVDMPPLEAPPLPGDCAPAAPAITEQANTAIRALPTIWSSGCSQVNHRRTRALHQIATG
jgi:hypothetical protein